MADNHTELLRIGDRVKADSGLTGKIVLLHRMSAFVEIDGQAEGTAVSYLQSELTKIKPSESENSS